MYTSFYTYLLVLGGQTAGPNWLTFLKAKQNFFLKMELFSLNLKKHFIY